MRIDKLPIDKETMCVQVVSSNTNHMIYCLDENADVIQVTTISEATLDEVVSMIPHMVIIVLNPHNVFEMICGFKLRAGHIFEPNFYLYDHMAWRYFLDKEMLYIIREFSKLNNVEKYEFSDEYQEKKHCITDYIYSKTTPIEKENNQVHQRMIKARQYQIDVLKDWVL